MISRLTPHRVLLQYEMKKHINQVKKKKLLKNKNVYYIFFFFYLDLSLSANIRQINCNNFFPPSILAVPLPNPFPQIFFSFYFSNAIATNQLQ